MQDQPSETAHPSRASDNVVGQTARRIAPDADGLWIFYLLVFAIAWGVGLLFAVASQTMGRIFGPVTLWNPLVFLTVWSPTLLAFGVTAAKGGLPGLKDLLRRIFRWRFPLRWYLTATVGLAAIALGARFLQSAIQGDAPPPLFDVAHWPQFAAGGLAMLVLDPGPIGEDPGWRGFALPRMLDRFSPTTAALGLGVIWTVWHLPAFLFSGMPQSSLPLGWFCVAMVSVTVLMAWVTINTGGAVIPAILMHWSFNRFSDLNVHGAMYAALTYTAAAAIVIGCTKGTLGYRRTT